MRLQNKVAVVTGASSGMGRAIVARYVKEGANVVAVARRKERLDALAQELANEPGKIVVFQGDISRREDNEAMIDLAVKEFGRLDILVNNAGIMDDMGPIGDLTDEMYDLITEEDLDDILENRIVNPEILEWIETAGLTVEDICTWYFID
jgi:NAD(P)-dependent dehydrogenase (short-subunit alcohol dehydrogenase family)